MEEPTAIAQQLIDSYHHPQFDHVYQQVIPYINTEILIALRKKIAVITRSQGYKAGIELIPLAQRIAQHINSEEAHIHVLWARGNVYISGNYYHEAYADFHQAEQFFTRQNNLLNATAMQINQLLSLREWGEYERALTLASKAQAVCQAIGESADRYRVNIDMTIAWIYEELGNPHQALATYKQLLPLLERLQEWSKVGYAKINSGYVLGKLNRYQEAEKALLEARSLMQKTNHMVADILIDLNLGLLAHGKGLYQAALTHFDTAYQKYNSYELPVEKANVNIHRSTLYRDLNLLQETITIAAEATQIFKQKKMSREQTRGIINQGIAYQRMGQYEQAARFLAKARRMLHQQGAWGKVWALDVDRAELTLQMGKDDTAWRIGRRTENKISSEQHPSLAARLHLLLAQCRLNQQQQLDEAHHRLNTALKLCNQYHLAEIKVKTYALQGQLAESNADLTKAQHLYQQAVTESQRLLSYLAMDEFQMGFMEGKLDVYTDFVRLTHRLIVNNTPSINEDDLLHSLNLMQTAPLPHNTAVFTTVETTTSPNSPQLTELRQQWQWFQHKLGGGWQNTKQENEADIRQQLHTIELKMAELMRQQRIQDVTLNQTTATITTAPTQLRQSLQQQLTPNDALLQFYEADGHCHALVITQTAVFLTPNLAPSKTLQKVMRAWHFYLRQVQSGREVSAHPYLTRLYQYLITPIAKQLNPHPHLYIVLPPAWHDLPLAALYDGQQYLVEHYRLTYLSAPDVLLTQQSPTTPAQPHAFVLGYDNNGRLPHAHQEADTVTKTLTPAWHVHQTVADAATAAAFRTASQTSHLIHLATHAVFRPDNPYFSWIQLAESSLTVADLYHITLPQRPLVVLSACETGRGLARGGGLLGMGRGFLAAGASGLIVTLWRVSDKATAQLVNHFYTQLTHTHETTAVLQQAQQKAIIAGLSPFYWAGFIFVGG